MTAAMPGMAFSQSFQCQPAAFNYPVLGDGFYGIVRTSWVKAAHIPDERAKQKLISPNKKYGEKTHKLKL